MTSFNQRLVQEWQAMGHRVTVLNYSVQYPSWLFPGTTQFTDEPAPDHLESHRLLHSVGPLSWWRSGRWLAAQKPDLVLLRYWTPFMAPALGFLTRIARHAGLKAPVVLLSDNLKPHEKVPGTGPLNRWVLGAADRVVTLSKSVAGEALALGFKGPVQVLHHPVYDHFGPLMDRSAACQALGLSTEGSYFLFFGLVRPYKGLDLLLRALVSPEFGFWNLPEGRSWSLVVAGEFYEPIEPYRRLLEELGLQDRVILHPTFVPDQRVAAYFGVAEALVLPYRHATQSGVTQAALHFGVPMVVTRVGGLAEELEGKGAGELCNPEVGELAAALQRFCTHPNRSSYRDSVQKLASLYGWRPFAEAVLADEGIV